MAPPPGAKPEIRHQFRAPEKHPLPFIPIAFAGLQVLLRPVCRPCTAATTQSSQSHAAVTIALPPHHQLGWPGDAWWAMPLLMQTLVVKETRHLWHACGAQVALFLALVWALFSYKGVGASLRGLPRTAGGALAGVHRSLTLATVLSLSCCTCTGASARPSRKWDVARHLHRCLLVENTRLCADHPQAYSGPLLWLLAALGFHGGLFSVLALYLLFWVQLSFLQLLPLLAVAGAGTVVFGYLLLSHLASRAAA